MERLQLVDDSFVEAHTSQPAWDYAKVAGRCDAASKDRRQSDLPCAGDSWRRLGLVVRIARAKSCGPALTRSLSHPSGMFRVRKEPSMPRKPLVRAAFPP